MIDAGAARTLADRLADSAPLWRPAPFHADPDWVTDTPALAGVLLSLTDADVDALEDDPAALTAWFAARVPLLAELFTASAACIAPLPPPAPLDEPEAHGRDVPGRKWNQLLHFAAACGTPAGPLVEWCSGKAHLGRLLARRHGTPVTSIERDVSLCADGRRLAERERLPVRFLAADVLQLDAAGAGLTDASHALALHACGDLHLTLLRIAGNAGVRALDVAPCCYHLTRDEFWRPLSAALAGTSLEALALGRDELRLAVQETVTSSPRVIRQQRTLAAWRLGFDALQRELRDNDSYLPTPSRPARVLHAGFPVFCADMARHHGLALPAGTDFPRYAARGEARLARVRRLELLRHACRRSLETLLVADRALFLTGRGYRVQVREFCTRVLTPRNLLIQARLPDTAHPQA